MTLELPTPLLWLGAYLTTAGGIWLLFDIAEKVVRPDIKIAISQWLKDADPDNAMENWRKSVYHAIDWIFGEDPDSTRFYILSNIASVFSVFVMMFVWAGLRPEQFNIAVVETQANPMLLTVLISLLFINMMPDYVSLRETRWLLRKISPNSTIYSIIYFIIIDLIATVLILFVSALIFSLSAVVMNSFYNWIVDVPNPVWQAIYRNLDPDSSPLIWELFVSGPQLTVGGDRVWPGGVLFYSTFFTSVWLWLFGLSGLLVRLIRPIFVGMNLSLNVLDFDNKPLQSLGFISIVLVGFIYLALALI